MACNYEWKNIRDLVKSGCIPVDCVFLSNGKYISVLQLAIITLDYEFIDFLLTNHVDLNQNILNEGTALHLAIKIKDLNLVKIFVYSGADINTLSNGLESSSPLHIAVIFHSYEIVEFLLNSGADINAVRDPLVQGCYRWTPLALAIFLKDTRMVKLLLKNGATIDHGSIEVCSSVQLAFRANDTQLLQILKDLGANVNILQEGKYSKVFELAVEEDNLEVFRFFVKDCEDINRIADNVLGDTLVHKAVENSSDLILQYLLNSGAHINSLNKENMTPFNLAHYRLSENSGGGYNRYEKIVSMLEQHIIKLQAANLPVNNSDVKLVSRITFNTFYNECMKELHQMRRTKVISTNLNYYQLLHKCTHKLAVGLTNVDNDFFEQELAGQFPLYGAIIFVRLKKAIERRNLLSHSKQLYEIFNYYLPSLFTRQIFEYLDNDDLKLLNDCNV